MALTATATSIASAMIDILITGEYESELRPDE
jgi:hypothetical protein